MFQNIAREFEEENSYEDVKSNKKENRKELLKKIFCKKMIILYIISFMVSFSSISGEVKLAPFGIAMLASILSNCIPIGIIGFVISIGTFVAFGGSNTLTFLLMAFILLVSILIKRPKFEDESNEKRKLGTRVILSTFIVNIIPMFFKSEYIVYDFLQGILFSVAAYIFYKIFTNGITVISEIGEEKAYSIEEVMGAALLLAVAFASISNIYIFGFSLRNILCILIVMVMGWKSGILVGATTGIAIGTVLGVIGNGDIELVASFALSGMIAGIFSKLGKIGVIAGFVLGNIALTYVANGNTVSIIPFQEILIASLGLLAIPKNIKINIKDLYNDYKLLPETTGRTLEENKETIYKLNSMSETISQMAKSYEEAAATIVDEEELLKQEKENQKIFERELQFNLEGLEDNILFDDLYSPEDDRVSDIFEVLLEKERIEKQDILDIFEKYHSYIILNENTEAQIKEIVKVINDAYKVSKINFIWKKKLDENKKVVSNQLEEVSKAIGKLAQDIEGENSDDFLNEKEQIRILLEQKEIEIKDIKIKQEKTGRKIVTIYTDCCENVENPTCDVKKMAKVISKVMNENMVIQSQECGTRAKKDICTFVYMSEDNLNIQIGVAKTTKQDSNISGDTSVQTKLEDGKYLLAISDGMGSGRKAKKSSKVVISMLENLITSGFDKDTSLKLINSTLNLSSDEDMYATLDMAVLDLYSQNLEFIKNGACPTYVKSRREVQILKSVSLPTGIINDIDLVVYEKDLKDGDIIVMCSDGIIESCTEYTNKALWLKFLLEEIQTDDVQKIADIILKEAVDNNYGLPKDDMTVMVAKVTQKPKNKT